MHRVGNNQHRDDYRKTPVKLLLANRDSEVLDTTAAGAAAWAPKGVASREQAATICPSAGTSARLAVRPGGSCRVSLSASEPFVD